MTSMAFIGFGEAGAAFARSGDFAYDIKTGMTGHDGVKRRDYAAASVFGCDSAAEALAGKPAVFSLVTADQALAVARDYAPFLAPDALWFDMNSVAPGTKRVAAAAVEASGGRYVDVAVMAPVQPARWAVPLLVAGRHSDAAIDVLRAAGFTNVQGAGTDIGDASAIKMIRSVMVKGIEALTAECLLAAHRAGVTDAVLASLDASWPSQDWATRADYNLDRMLAHGLRRAAEMEESAKTLADLGVDALMTRATIRRQHDFGTLAIAPPRGLAAKLAAIAPAIKGQAA